MARGQFDSEEFIQRTPGYEYMTDEQIIQAQDAIDQAMHSVHTGMGRDWYKDNPDLDYYFEITGLDQDSPIFWEMFREWYGG